jgi:hypothetical protein
VGVRKEVEKRRTSLAEVFGNDTVVEGASPAWRIAGEMLPGLKVNSEWFFETMTLSRGLGVYDALSGYTHPTLWALRAHQYVEPMPDGGVDPAWTTGSEFIGRLCATTASTLYRMLSQMAGYFGWDEARVERWAEELNAWCPDLIRG